MGRYTDEFMDFWKLYPGRYRESHNDYPKKNKYLAMKEWSKLSQADRGQAMFAVKKLSRGRYVKDAFRWLRDKAFDDYEPPDTSDYGGHLPREMTEKVFKGI